MANHLTRGDIGNAISALDLAIEWTEALRRSYLPPRQGDFDAQDNDNAEIWSSDLLTFRRLRRKLCRIEKIEWGEDL